MSFLKKTIAIAVASSTFFQPIFSASTATQEKPVEQKVNWQTYTYDANNFSVELPSKPDHIRQKIDVPKSDVKIEYDTYVSEPSDDIVYVISVWDYPAEVDMSKPEINLKDGFGGMLSALPGSKVIDSKMTDVQGFKALEFLVKNDDVYFQGKLIIAYNTLYQIFTVYRDKVDMEKNYKQFINSFKILNPDQLKVEQHKSASKNSRLNV